MRYIDNSKFIPPGDWAAKVATAKTHFVNTGIYRPIWTDLAENLNNLVRDDRLKKCWYTEIIIKGSNFDVDHFRPKGNVKALSKKFADLDVNIWCEIEKTGRAGYNFLVYEWTNFRVASQHSNQGRIDGKFTKGKQDFFPLKNNSIVSTTIADLDKEDICLLDPCKKNDPEHLKFFADGKVDALYPAGSWEYCRAKISIEIYHLHFELNGIEAARLIKWNECLRELDSLIILYELKAAVEVIRGQIDKIKTFINKGSEFSAVAIDCIRHCAKDDNYFFIQPLAKMLVK